MARSDQTDGPRSPSDQGTVRTIALAHPDLSHVDVRVRRSARSRSVRLHVDEQGAVRASIPRRFALHRLDDIVRDRGDWLVHASRRMQHAARGTEVDLEGGGPVRVLGQWMPTRLERGGRRSSVRLIDGRLVLRVPEDGDAWEALVTWYRREARSVFEGRVAYWSQCLNVVAGKVSIREQRTRWGSCSHRGDLSFNWRLLLAPDWVIDSIVVHELCHIDELNHSSRFWALLDDRYPRHAEASEWLRRHGAALRVTRPAAESPTTTLF